MLPPTHTKSFARAVSLGIPALCAFCLTAAPAFAQGRPDSLAADTAAVERLPVAGHTGIALVDLGLENVTVAAGDTIAYENRRWRHSAEARGRAVQTLGVHPDASKPTTVFERRLGLTAAAIVDTGGGVPAAVRYPSDRDFTAPPAGPMLNRTSGNLDLEFRPLLTYELGRIFDPVLIRLELEPALRYNPWPGGRATLSLIIPMRNDFEVDELHPDINQTRPGLIAFDQFAWLPGAALVSATAGVMGDNRYGLSVGAARPLASGAWLLDSQADFTGYIAFTDSGTVYSAIERFTGFAGVTWRPPALDLAVRLRAERFLYGDNGAELELRRAMGDVEIAMFYQRTAGLNVQGVRLAIPIPPLVRPTRWKVRPLPIDRLPLEYRDESAPVGHRIRGAASREEFLRQLSQPGLAANADRYAVGLGEPRRTRAGEPPQWVSWTGMTGFVNTPWCGVMGDRDIEMGYNQIPKGSAYDHRGQYRNDVYYASIGFIPRLEVGLRWTVIPGLKSFADLVPDSRLTDSDRMLSGRVEVLRARSNRPGLAVGIEDAVGTRRFHSVYVVSGIPLAFQGLRGRASVGYAPDVLTASRHTLDGGFGAFEVSPWRRLAATFEYDSEKWNTSLGIDLGFGFRARAALLDGRDTSFGAGWFVAL